MEKIIRFLRSNLIFLRSAAFPASIGMGLYLSGFEDDRLLLLAALTYAAMLLLTTVGSFWLLDEFNHEHAIYRAVHAYEPIYDYMDSNCFHMRTDFRGLALGIILCLGCMISGTIHPGVSGLFAWPCIALVIWFAAEMVAILIISRRLRRSNDQLGNNYDIIMLQRSKIDQRSGENGIYYQEFTSLANVRKTNLEIRFLSQPQGRR